MIIMDNRDVRPNRQPAARLSDDTLTVDTIDITTVADPAPPGEQQLALLTAYGKRAGQHSTLKLAFGADMLQLTIHRLMQVGYDIYGASFLPGVSRRAIALMKSAARQAEPDRDRQRRRQTGPLL